MQDDVVYLNRDALGVFAKDVEMASGVEAVAGLAAFFAKVELGKVAVLRRVEVLVIESGKRIECAAGKRGGSRIGVKDAP